MGYKHIELNDDEFKHDIARIFNIDNDRDLFDIQEDVFNILQNSEFLEGNQEKDISLNKIEIEDITCFYIEKKEDNEEYTFLTFNNYEEAKKYYDIYTNIKTIDGWHKSNADYFDKFCKPGDIVSQDIVDEFANSLPPIICNEKYVQAGEPYNSLEDPKDHKFKSTYTTFEKNNDGMWVYKGNCFKGQNIDTEFMSGFEIVDNIEDFEGDKLLLQSNCTVVSLKKDKYMVTLETNGEVEIENKKGDRVYLDDEDLKKSIDNGTFEKKYSVESNNWLEICYYKLNENGIYYEQGFETDVLYGISELGNSKEEIKRNIEEILDDFIIDEEETEEIEQ